MIRRLPLVTGGAALAVALLGAGPGAARPLTTAPPQVITVKITITDRSVHMAPKAVPRGDFARFVLVNTGKKRHVFALGSVLRQTGKQTGFTRGLNPAEQSILLLFLDLRGSLPYLGTLPADRSNPAMKGVFKVY